MRTSLIEIKHQNYRDVYLNIYKNKKLSKQAIATNLGMSLPTVSNNLSSLAEKGLITKEGTMDSTGGRPASYYKCNPVAKLSIGVELLVHGIVIAAVDLYGNILAKDSLDILFSNSDKYFNTFGKFVLKFIENNIPSKDNLLGVCIAIPGIMDEDNENVMYSEVLRTSGLHKNKFTSVLGMDCTLIHNAEAAATAELWHGNKVSSAIYCSLDMYFSNALLINGSVFKSSALSSGTMEHLIIHENGEKCYCGKQGCIDAYCSANSLLRLSGEQNVDTFFLLLRNGDEKMQKIWCDYLKNLALAFDNARMLVGFDIIIGGLLQRYINDDDIAVIKSNMQNLTTFKNATFDVFRGKCGRDAVVNGVAIPAITDFINNI